MDDNQISLQAISRMDSGALAQVYDRYAPDIYKYVYRHICNAQLADQTVGEVFARLLEQLCLGRGPRSNLRSYLFEIAYHVMVDEIRLSQRVQPLPSSQVAPSAAGGIPGNLEQHMLLEVVWCAIRDDLSADQRHVIVLRFLEDFSLKETARVMGKNVGHIKVLQGRAVAALRQALDRHELQAGLMERAALSQNVG